MLYGGNFFFFQTKHYNFQHEPCVLQGCKQYLFSNSFSAWSIVACMLWKCFLKEHSMPSSPYGALLNVEINFPLTSG